MLKVGYVGLGAMGGSLSVHLTKKFDLMVLDRNPSAVSALVAQGAKQANAGAELARACDVIVLCLPRTSDVKDAIFGPNGLAEGLTPGKLVIDQSSGIPRETLIIAEKLASQGVAMVDAPVSGGIPAAQSGRVTIIASGSEAAWKIAEPVLRAMTQSVFWCSDRVGDGQALKLVNNAIGAGYRMATLELVALGRKMGLSLERLVKTLNEGHGANFTTRNMLVGLVEGRSTTNFALALMVKDLNEALSLGAETSSTMPMTAGARGLMQMGLNLLGKDAMLDNVIPLIENLSGVKFKPEEDGSLPLMAGKNEAELLALIDRATMACNVVAVLECVAMGRKFGLPISQMATILNVGSAWSRVSEVILPALALYSAPKLAHTFENTMTDLVSVVRYAAQVGVPLTLPNTLVNFLQFSLVKLEDKQTDFGAIAMVLDPSHTMLTV
jgi:3-hydroxyisobutyrate dehydrogenase